MADRQVRIIISADVAAAIRGMRDVEGGLGRVGSAGRQAERSTSSFGDKLKTALAAGGVTLGIAGVVTGLKAVISTGLDYEKSMHTFQAVTGANVDVMKRMADTAKALGNDVTIPGASAQSTAAAMTELAKAGFTADEAMGAARGTMVLAAAAQIDGAAAATIQANAMNMFSLKADQAGHVADVLANTANASSGEITDFAQALSQSGTVANAFGVSIDDTSTMLGLFAKAGIRGSDAGTSLKTMLTALNAPTDSQAAGLEALGINTRNAAGEFVGMRSITEQLAGAHTRLSSAEFDSAAQAAFGSDAIRGGLVASAAATTGWDKMSGAVTKAGGAQDVAAANAQGFTGALDGLMNAASTAALALYEGMAPALTAVATAGAVVATAIGDAIGWFTQLPAPIQVGVTALTALILLKGPMAALWTTMKASGVGMAIQGEMLAARLSVQSLRLQAQLTGGSMGVMSASMRVAGVAAVGLGNSLKAAFLSNPIGLGLVAATTALSFFMSKTDDAAESTQNYTDVIDDQTGALKENAAQLISAKVEASGLGDKWRALGGDTSVLVDAIGRVPGKLEEANAFLAAQKQAALDATAALSGATGATNDYATAAGGVGTANQAAGLSFNQTTTAVGEQSTGYKTATEAGDLFQQQVGSMNSAIDTQTHTAEGAAGALGAAGTATVTAGDAAAAATEKIDPFKDALDGAKDAANLADEATRFLTNSLTVMAGGSISAEAATRANEAAFRDIAASARDLADANQTVSEKQAHLDELSAHLGKTLDGQAVSATNLAVTQADVDKASRDLADAQAAVADAGDRQFDTNKKVAQSAIDMASAAYNTKAANGDMAGGIADATAVMETQRQKFIDSQVAAGMERDAAGKLADQLGLIPANVTTTFKQQGASEALAQAQALNAELAKTNNTTIHYKVVGDQVTVAGAGIPLISGNQARADGGWISGPGGPREDKVRAALSPGEFVVNAAQASKHGGLLEAINGGLMGFADGGPVPDPAAATGAAAAVAVQGAVAVPDVTVIQAAWAAISAAVQTAWATVIQPALDALSVATLRTNTEFVALQTESVEPTWAANSAAVAGSVNGVILPTYAVLTAGTDSVAADQHALFDFSVAPVWTATGQLIAGTWAGTIAPTYAQLNAGSSNVGLTFQQLAGVTTVSWGQIGSTINATYTGQIVPAWQGVQGFASSMGGFFQGLQSNVSASATSVTSDLAQITGAINDFFALVDGKAPASSTAGAAATVTASLAAFADGGILSGPGGPRSDNLLIAASPGEYVVNAAATAKHKDELDAINFGGAFADGGMVGGQLQTAVNDGAHRAISAAVEQVLKALTPSIPGFSGPVPPGARGAFMQAVLSKQGTAYVWGAAGPDVFDCSGLMSWGLIQAGVGKGRLTAAEFGDDFPRVNPEKPGDMAIFDTGRVSPKAGHIGAVLDPTAGTMMHTDGAGPARVSPYRGRSGLMGFVDAIGGDYSPTPSAASKQGDPPAANWLQAMLEKIKSGGTAASSARSGNVAYNLSAGVEQWRGTVLAALSFMGESASLVDTVLHQMDTESSGNPNAINLTDSNAQRGTPSKGLVQVIDPTFRSFAMAPYDKNIWDPLSNIIAGANYARHQYGSIAAGMRGVAYDNGGPMAPGYTLAYNGTGKDEMTLTNSQWQTARSATLGIGNYASGSNGGGAQRIIVEFRGDGVITSEMANTASYTVDGALEAFAGALGRQKAQAMS